MPRNADREVESLQTREEYAPQPTDPRGVRNRNPGNIRTGQGFRGEGAPDSGGYATFDTAHNGIRAVAYDLLSKYRRGLVTVRSIITVYAPPEDNNDTEAYIQAVCRVLGVMPYTWLRLPEADTLEGFVTAIIKHECGGNKWYSADDIAAACADALRSKGM